VRESPTDVSDAAVLDTVRRLWDARVDRVGFLPVGFGAHHWAAYAGAEPRLFVTFDGLEPKRSAAHLEAAYSGATALRDAGLAFVLAPVPAATGVSSVPFSDGALSCTPWRDGTSGGDLDLPWTAAALADLHATAVPPGLPVWRPVVGPHFADELATRSRPAWGPGPYSDEARRAVRSHRDDVARWTRRYHHLATAACERLWVPTHGEPHSDNQLLTDRGRLLVDWESLTLAPAELDLRTRVGAGADPHGLGADQEMLELFDLEWRLDEISQYAAWFAGATHRDTGRRDRLPRTPGRADPPRACVVTSATRRKRLPSH
jgi:spectinomycin phosphotransferase